MGEEGSGIRAIVLAVLGLIALGLGVGLVWPGTLQGRGSWTPVDVATVRVMVTPDHGAIEVDGLTAGQLARIRASSRGSAPRPIVSLYADEAVWEDTSFPSVSARIGIEGRTLIVRPKYPLLPGHEYHLLLGPPGPPGSGRDRLVVRTPQVADDAPASVSAVFPSGDLLPENQLKLYVEFSRPMRRWGAYANISLIDETTGAPVLGAFHSMQEGLWDASGTRLTVVFDPGRVKRGLANHERFGAPLRSGHRYRLEIDDGWLDARGRPMEIGHSKRFAVMAADRTSPDPWRWTIEPPTAGTLDPLTVRFPESMDRALLEGGLALEGAGGWPVEGLAEPGSQERTWRFTPLRAWPSGEFRLRVDPHIEDLGGNNVLRLFDVDLRSVGTVAEGGGDDEAEPIRIPFSVHAGAISKATP